MAKDIASAVHFKAPAAPTAGSEYVAEHRDAITQYAHDGRIALARLLAEAHHASTSGYVDWSTMFHELGVIADSLNGLEGYAGDLVSFASKKLEHKAVAS